MSLYGVDFLRRAGALLACGPEPGPDVQFREQGYLFLAPLSPGRAERTLRENHEVPHATTPPAKTWRAPWDSISMGV